MVKKTITSFIVFGMMTTQLFAAEAAISSESETSLGIECRHYYPPVPPAPPAYSNNGCDYSDALRNNGWGWDPISGTSCPPRCDYSNANLNNGWGWDPYTGMSCPPQ